MRASAPEFHIDSAGTGAWHIGKPPYGPMQQAAAGRGIDLNPLRARQFRAADFDRFDLIIAMDRQNQRDIENLRPPGNQTPVQMLGTQDVPDPYYTGDFDGTLDIISAGLIRLKNDIAAGRGN